MTDTKEWAGVIGGVIGGLVGAGVIVERVRGWIGGPGPRGSIAPSAPVPVNVGTVDVGQLQRDVAYLMAREDRAAVKREEMSTQLTVIQTLIEERTSRGQSGNRKSS